MTPSKYEPDWSSLIDVAVTYPGGGKDNESRNHSVTKQGDSSYLCKNCGAESFDLKFMDEIPCNNSGAVAVPPGTEPSVRIGDVWQDDTNMWVRGVSDDGEPAWFDAASTGFIAIRAKKPTSPTKPGWNPAVITVEFKTLLTETAIAYMTDELEIQVWRQLGARAANWQREFGAYRITPMRRMAGPISLSTSQREVSLRFEARPKP